MPEDTIYHDASEALQISSKNRLKPIHSYIELGNLNPTPIPKQVIQSDESSTLLTEAEKLLEKSIAKFSKSDLKNATAEVSRFSLAMFLLDRTTAIGNLVRKKNQSGSHSLYLSLRNQVCEFLDDGYYLDTTLSSYVDLEPLLAACSDLCGLAPIAIDKVMAEYKAKLAGKLDKV